VFPWSERDILSCSSKASKGKEGSMNNSLPGTSTVTQTTKIHENTPPCGFKSFSQSSRSDEYHLDFYTEVDWTGPDWTWTCVIYKQSKFILISQTNKKDVTNRKILFRSRSLSFFHNLQQIKRTFTTFVSRHQHGINSIETTTQTTVLVVPLNELDFAF
jgi:hypothetical protein